MPTAFDPDGRGPSSLRLVLSGICCLIVIACAATAMVAVSRGAFHKTVAVTALMADVGDGLPPKSDVKFQGVRVGEVTAVTSAPAAGMNSVGIRLDPQYAAQIPATVTARVVPSNVFAVPSIQLVYNGSAPAVTAHTVIAEDHSQETVRLQSSLDRLRRIVAAVGRDGMDRSVGMLAVLAEATSGRGTAIEDAGTQLRDIVRQLDTVVSADEVGGVAARSPAGAIPAARFAGDRYRAGRQPPGAATDRRDSRWGAERRRRHLVRPAGAWRHCGGRPGSERRFEVSYRRSLVVLVVFAVVCSALIWIVGITLERGVSGATDKYSALFTDVSGLRVGDDVRVAGVRVGRVDAIELDGSLARVGFEVQRDQTLSGRTTVSVTYQNLIGQRYLGLAQGERGAAGALRPGAVIPVANTEPSFDISRLLKGFEPLFGTLDRAAIDNITGALIKALQGDNGALTTLIAETTRLAESFTGPDQVLGQVITNLNTIVGNLAAQSGNLGTVIEQTRAVFEGLDKNKQSLVDSVDRMSTVIESVAQAAAADQPAVREFLARNPGFAQHFLDNKGKFEFLGFNLPLVLKGLARVTQEGGYVEAYVCDVTVWTVPGLTPLIPQIVDGITPGGAAQHTARCR